MHRQLAEVRGDWQIPLAEVISYPVIQFTSYPAWPPVIPAWQWAGLLALLASRGYLGLVWRAGGGACVASSSTGYLGEGRGGATGFRKDGRSHGGRSGRKVVVWMKI